MTGECPECGLTIRHTEDCPLRHAAYRLTADNPGRDDEPFPTLPDDVAGVIAECISDAENIREAYPSKTLRKAADTIERLVREIITLRNFLKGIQNNVDLALMDVTKGTTKDG